jgi:predicted HAD superfamily phosphohydrolase YqeG
MSAKSLDVEHSYKVCQLRNSGQAYRQFHCTGILTDLHETLVKLMRHKATASLIALMGTAGLIGGLITFWP